MVLGTAGARGYDEEIARSPWLSGVLEHLKVGIGIFDDSGALTFANGRFADDFARATGPGDAPFECAFFQLSGSPMSRRSHPCVCIVTRRTAGMGGSPTAGSTIVSSPQVHEHPPGAFRKFADASSSAIVIASPVDGTVDYANAAACEFWPPARICGSLAEWEETLHPDDIPVAKEHRSKALQGRPQKFEYRIVADTGEVIRHVRECCFSIAEHGARGVTIGAIVEDISPQLQIYLIQAEKSANSLIDDGLRDIAHGLSSFGTAAEFLDVAELLEPGCVIVDVRNADIGADRLLEILRSRPSEMQVIFIGARETTAAQVIEVLKAGASDYLLDPFDSSQLQSSLFRACRPLWDWHPRKEAKVSELNAQLLALPRREREVLLGLVSGGTNKSIARSLKLSPRTVEVHRCHLMQRLNVRTLTELLHVAHEAGLRG